MKKIFIPVAVVVLILAIIAVILSKTNPTENPGYHVHEDGVTHYDEIVDTTYHVHDDGVTHYDEH
ncbi:MAG: hypothetical protein IKK60_04670 [Clostridia bacterium]|nr:hypothetical protein [Clostridia bacterium]